MPAEALHRRIEASLVKRKQNGNLRSLDPPLYDPNTLVDFSSNDYLSLSKSALLRDRFQRAVASTSNTSPLTPYGPASSRLLDGNSPAHIALERRLAAFFRGEAAVLFNSGFDANAGVFACLPSTSDALFYDELIHASTHDGMRNCRTPIRRPFRHNSAKDLERLLAHLLDGQADIRQGHSQVFVAVEAVYSMDGDIAPLLDYVQLLERMLPKGNGHLIVDEAHSTGLYGPSGRGLVCALGLEERVLLRLHTFGKAMSCSGGK